MRMRNAELMDKQLFLRNVLSALETGIAKLKWAEPGPVATVPIIQKALVVGGGIAGMQAALDIGNAGHTVYLVERQTTVGGHMLQFDKTFPTLDCAACIGTPKMVEVAQNANIRLLT